MYDMRQKQQSGVSPVIGVILMVAITVIVAAIVASFVLDLGGNLEEDADATITFDQQANFGSGNYNVTVTVTQMDNADYLVVSDLQNSLNQSDYVVNYSGGDPTTNIDGVPQNASQTSVGGDNGVILISSGDTVTLPNLDPDNSVQVFGGLSGSENLIQEYQIEDTLGN